MSYTYHVIPAPTKGRKTKGAKSADARYAAALAETLNAEAAAGWEFVRAEVLPSSERQGLTGSKTVYVNVLVFRRPATTTGVAATAAAPAIIAETGTPAALPAPGPDADPETPTARAMRLHGVTGDDRI